MRWISTIAIILLCAACQSPEVAVVPPAEPVCHDFTTPVTAGGRPEQARGQACEQPDGSWQVVQNTPGLPAQAYVLNPPGEPAAAAGSTPVQLQPSQSRTNQSPAGQSPAGQSPAGQSPAGQSACSSYTAPVTVGEQPRQA